jgi:hypothetical protein
MFCSKKVESVTRCATGQLFSGSAVAIQTNLTSTTCAIGYTDACVKVYSGSAYAAYGCASSSLCNVVIGVTSEVILSNNPRLPLTISYPASTVCCYTDNCNNGSDSIKIKLFFLISSILLSLLSFF